MKPWYSKAMCEVCGQQPAISFSYFEGPLTCEYEAWAEEQRGKQGPPVAVSIADIQKTPYVPMREFRPPPIGSWKFTCLCTAETEQYYIEFRSFFRHPQATVDWLAHMHEKYWFDPEDWSEMMMRFRAATGSFFKMRG